MLVVYDLLGSEAARLVDGELEAGWHEARRDATGFPSGTYLSLLPTDTGFNQVQHLTRLR